MIPGTRFENVREAHVVSAFVPRPISFYPWCFSRRAAPEALCPWPHTGRFTKPLQQRAAVHERLDMGTLQHIHHLAKEPGDLREQKERKAGPVLGMKAARHLE